MAKTRKTALLTVWGTAKATDTPVVIRDIQNAEDGHTCQAFPLGFGKLALFALELVPLEQRDPEIGIVENTIYDLFRSVQTVFTNGRNNVASQPFLKRKGDRLVRTTEKEIEPLLGNDEHFLFTTKGSNRITTLPFLRDSLKNCRHVRAGIAKGLRNVLRHKPRFVVAFYDADGTE